MLELTNTACSYGRVTVLRDVTFELAAGEVLGLLGRNGAGKTTTLKAILGLVRVSSGSIRLRNQDLTRLPAHQIPGQGIAYVPQGRRLFPELTVRENLEMGLLVSGAGADTLNWALDLFPVLRDRLKQRAGTLSGGQQQMVAMARALCTRPKIVLLDEPSEGLMPSLVEVLLETIHGLKQDGVGVLLVEQKVEAVLRIADRVVFLENGYTRLETTPARLDADPEPLQRFVGVRR